MEVGSENIGAGPEGNRGHILAALQSGYLLERTS